MTFCVLAEVISLLNRKLLQAYLNDKSAWRGILWLRPRQRRRYLPWSLSRTVLRCERAFNICRSEISVLLSCCAARCGLTGCLPEEATSFELSKKSGRSLRYRRRNSRG